MSEDATALYLYWSVGQQMSNAIRNSVGHLSDGGGRTLCGKVITRRWDSAADVLGTDFGLDDVGCKRCRTIAERR